MCSNLYEEGLGGFANENYWSSSENDTVSARYIYFSYNEQTCQDKTTLFSVRPVRYF